MSRADQAATEIIDRMRELSEGEREDVFSALKSEFCEHCGCEQPERSTCQCWNDE